MSTEHIVIRGDLVPIASLAVEYGADIDLSAGETELDMESPDYHQVVLLRELSPAVRAAQGFEVDEYGDIGNSGNVTVQTMTEAETSLFDTVVSPNVARSIAFNARTILAQEHIGSSFTRDVLHEGLRSAINNRRKLQLIKSQLAELALLDLR